MLRVEAERCPTPIPQFASESRTPGDAATHDCNQAGVSDRKHPKPSLAIGLNLCRGVGCMVNSFDLIFAALVGYLLWDIYGSDRNS